MHGFGTKTKTGLTQIGYWDRNWDGEIYDTLPFDVLKYHQDTTFARFSPCDNCLTPTTVSIYSMGLVRANFDVFVNGSKTGTTRDWDLQGGYNELPGYVNNTTHVVYIKAYRIAHNKAKDRDEYVDESLAVKQGEKLLGNYRRLPEDGEFLDGYFKTRYFYLGQYARKVDIGVIQPHLTYILNIYPYTKDTHKIILKGTSIEMLAEGKINIGSMDVPCDPAGNDGWGAYRTFGNIRTGALMYRIGNGLWTTVGISTRFVAQTSGLLQFMINNSFAQGTTGYYQIKTWISEN